MSSQRPHCPERGNVLVLVLLLIMVLTSMALLTMRSIRIENTATSNTVAGVQARQAAYGAGRAVMSLQDGLPGDAVAIGEGSFWMVLPVYGADDPSEYRWGLIDESGKLNVNSATPEMLIKLPGMTAAIAAAIVDWRDADSTPITNGAENEYYGLLSLPYRAKNLPFETVDELLLVRDVTPELLYGEDLNRNGVLDPNEDDGDASAPADNADGQLDPGWIDLLTVVGGAAPSEGTLNVNDNGTSENDLRQAFTPVLGQERGNAVADAVDDNKPYDNLIDLLIKTELSAEEFAAIEPLLTTGNEHPHRININTAPPQVLLALPELNENDVEQLVSYRETNTTEESELGPLLAFASPTSEDASAASTTTSSATSSSAEMLSSIAWAREVLGDDKARAIGSYITTRTDHLTADVVAVAPGGRAFERYRWTFSRRGDAPGLITMERLTHLGWPLDPQLLSDLRAGSEISDLAETVERGDF